MLNAGAIEGTILAGMMLGCSTPPLVKWDRKNYFYPDMPKNYQTHPVRSAALPRRRRAALRIGLSQGLAEKNRPARPSVGLTRIHLEEDVGKCTHQAAYGTLDFNRAGTPLMEIVSEPEIESAEEAVAYLNSLRQILIYAGRQRCRHGKRPDALRREHFPPAARSGKNSGPRSS